MEQGLSSGVIHTNVNNAQLSPQSTRVTNARHIDALSQASAQVDLNRSAHSLQPSSRLAFTGTAGFKQKLQRNEISLKLDRTVKLKQRIRHLEEQLKIAVIQN